MSEEKKKRNKIIGISIGILVVLLVVISSTYAYWQITKSQEGSNDIIAACLDIDMESVDGTFALNPAWPISDSEGMQLDGYTFKVTNSCEEDVNYVIGMDSLVKEGVEYLDYNSIKVLIDNEEPVVYGKITDKIEHNEENDPYQIRDSKKLNTAVVYGNTSNTHNVKVWISSESGLDDREKVFSGRMFITGGQKIDNDKPLAMPTPEECFEMSGNEIIDYKEENSKCGESVVIPATVNGVAVKTIDSNAFKDEKLIPIYQRYDENSGEFVEVESLDISQADFSYVMREDGESPEYAIIYNESEEIIAVVDEILSESVDEFDVFYASKDELPDLEPGVQEIFAIYDSENLIPVGIKSVKLDNPLIVTGLDLSFATHLEKIEEVAFSNWPVVEKTKNECTYKIIDTNDDRYDNNNLPTGLTYLKMGKQSELLIGTAAFGSLTMDEFTIYTNVKAYSDCYNDDNLALSNPFIYSNINKLNVLATDDNSIFALNADGPFILSTINIININEGIKEIGKDTFETTVINNSITLPNSLERIESFAFANTAGNENMTITIPDNVKYIGDRAFRWWKTTNTINFTRTESEVIEQVTFGEKWNNDAKITYAQ